MNKIHEISSYKFINGKYILNKMKKEFLYDKNYLNKMIFDIEFIKYSNLILYFDILPNSKIDTFFTFFGNNFPIGNDLLKGIFEAKYILMENNLLNEIYNEKKNIFNNNKLHSSFIRNNSFNSKINYKINNSFGEEKSIINQKSLKNLNKTNISNKKRKKIKNEQKDNFNNSKEDEKLKLLNDFICRKEKEIEKIKKEEKKKKLKQKEEEKELKLQKEKNKLIEKEIKKYEYYEFISERASKIVDDLIYNNQYLIKENIIIKK